MAERDKLTDRIIGCAIKVAKTLSTGFLEKVYENSLMIELRKEGLEAEQQKSVKVTYDGQVVGNYIIDILVEESVVLELKAATHIDKAHEAQLLGYLRASGMEKGLILNFGSHRLGIRRMVM